MPEEIAIPMPQFRPLWAWIVCGYLAYLVAFSLYMRYTETGREYRDWHDGYMNPSIGWGILYSPFVVVAVILFEISYLVFVMAMIPINFLTKLSGIRTDRYWKKDLPEGWHYIADKKPEKNSFVVGSREPIDHNLPIIYWDGEQFKESNVGRAVSPQPLFWKRNSTRRCSGPGEL